MITQLKFDLNYIFYIIPQLNMIYTAPCFSGDCGFCEECCSNNYIKTNPNELTMRAQDAIKFIGKNKVEEENDKYSKAIKLTVREVEGRIQQFATTTLESIQAKTEATLTELATQMSNMEQFFVRADEAKDEAGNDGNSIVTYKQFQVLENKVDQLIMLQKGLSSKIFEMNQVAKVAAKKKVVAPKKVKPKRAPNVLRLP